MNQAPPTADSSCSSPPPPRSRRSVDRNLKRKQGGLITSGKLAREIVIAAFSNYDADKAGRYSISKDDLAALDVQLGR